MTPLETTPKDGLAYGVIEHNWGRGSAYQVVFVPERCIRGDVVEHKGDHAIIVAIFGDKAEALGWAKARSAE